MKMKLKIFEIFTTKLFLPWIAAIGFFIHNDLWLIAALVAFAPFVIVGLISEKLQMWLHRISR